MTHAVNQLHLPRRVSATQRHSRRRPCPICGGGHDDPRGRGVRCYGFTSADGRYARCSREEYAGALQPDRDGRHYVHRLEGICRCGRAHGVVDLDIRDSRDSRSRRSGRGAHDGHDGHDGQQGSSGLPGGRLELRDPGGARRFRRRSDLPVTVGGGYRLARVYPYHAANGEVAYEARRFELVGAHGGHGAHDGSGRRDKVFRVYTPCADGSWIEAFDAPRVLYHLPDILAAPVSAPVYVCEGEKAADALRAALAADAAPGVVTTTAGGAAAGHLTPLEALRGRRVVIVPDNDAAGRRYADVMAGGARAAGALAVAVVDLDGLPEKGDVVEWLAAGHSAPELCALAEARLAEAEQVSESDAAHGANGDNGAGAAGADDELAGFEPLGVLLSEVEPQEVRWFWRGYIPLGKVTTLDGDPGLGKSTLTAYLAACATRGLPLPDGTRCEPGGVVMLSAEDDAADTIRPRLDAAGADSQRVFQLLGVTTRDAEGKAQERDVYLPGDLPVLEAAIRKHEARLVVIDPLMAFLSDRVNSHRDQDVRGALRPLAALASRTGAAIVLVRHLNKAAGGNALYRGGGSIGIIGAARSGLLVAPDPDDPEAGAPNGRRALAVVKSNLGAAVPALTFRVVSATNGVGMIAWEGESSRTANDLMGQPLGEEERSLQDEAVEYLRMALADGPRRANEVRAEAPQELRAHALRRASTKLGVVKKRVGYGRGSYQEWSLPIRADRALHVGRFGGSVGPNVTIDGIGAIDVNQKAMTCMVSMEGDDIYDNGEGTHDDAEGDAAKDVCAVTGSEHATARLRTADGWLRCIECGETLRVRAG